MIENQSLDALEEALKGVREDSERVNEKVDEAQAAAYDVDGKEADTRSNITITFIYGFFITLLVATLFVLAYNYCAVNWILELNRSGLQDIAKNIHLLELDKTLSLMVSALGTSLGFIIGYYFKEKKK